MLYLRIKSSRVGITRNRFLLIIIIIAIVIITQKDVVLLTLSGKLKRNGYNLNSIRNGFNLKEQTGGAESDESLSNQAEFFKGCAKSIENLAEMFRVEEANCKAIFSGNKDDVNEGIHKANVTLRNLKSNGYYLNLTENCDVFKNARGYVTCPMTREEEEFPIAFSLVVYKDVEMVERLLRAIYRPQNYYCIHIDAKSDQDFFLAISGIAECFTNVFVSTQRVDVQWGEFSVLEPELLCMKQLWRYTKWKYFINLTGQEFPLKTNAQLVKILKAYNGANDVESTVKRSNPERWPTTPPRDFRPVKGASHITVNRY